MKDVIAAIASPPGTGAISVIRVSGDGAWDVVQRSLKEKIGDPVPRKVYMGTVADENGDVDRVLLVFYKAPKSYTGEDMVELFCHGGYTVTNMVLKTLLSRGARQAEPGEFTKRAFLNGKMDLSEAEAVRDLIEAKVEWEVRAFLKGVEGKLRDYVESLRKEILEILAEIEVELDYPEEITIDRERLSEKAGKILSKMDEVLKRAEKSVKISHGVKVVIVGRPNVGKSTLLNRLLREDRAIVTPIPGTTRDVISEDLNILGRHFRISDTAGLRLSEDEVEKIGVERAKKEIEKADLVLLMVDAGEGITETDRKIFSEVKDKLKIIVVNKIDISDISLPEDFEGETVVKLSALTGEGIERLEEAMVEVTEDLIRPLKADVVLTNQRQKELLETAKNHLEKGIKSLKEGFPTDIASIDFKAALKNLDMITGRDFTEDLLDTIFSNFCVGK